MRLKGKAALVTGGGRGLGRSITEAFSREGASVMVTDIDEGLAREVAGALSAEGSQAYASGGDVARAADVEAMVSSTVRIFGRLDIIVNNAGTGAISPLATFPNEEWDRVIAVNLTGVMYGCKYAWPHLARQGGVILNMASIAGLRGTPTIAAYGASKAAVIQLTKTAALEGAPLGIRANAICPAWIETRLTEAFIHAFGTPHETRERLTQGIPLGRIGDPADVAAAAVFLASDEARFVTGVAFPVDGGAMA